MNTSQQTHRAVANVRFGFVPRIARSLLLWTITIVAAGKLAGADVTLAWDPSTDPIAGYAIHYGTTSGDYSVRVDMGTSTTGICTNLLPGTTYYFIATAYTAGLESVPSAEIAYTVPFPTMDPEPVISSLVPTPGGTVLTWTTVPGRIYRVFYKANIADVQWTNGSSELPSTGNSLQWIDTALASQRFYVVMLVL